MATIKTSFPVDYLEAYLNRQRQRHIKYRWITILKITDLETGFDGVILDNREFPPLKRVEFDLHPYTWDRDHTRMISAFQDALEKVMNPIWRKF